MRSIQTAANEGSGVGNGGGNELPAAALFTIVWDAMAEMLGTAAVAAIVRRAAGRTVAESSDIEDLVILREDLEYRYVLPQTWSQDGGRGLLALRRLVAEIGRLLMELTGNVVISRLEAIPELVACGLVWRTEETN